VFSPDSKTLATADHEGVLRIWDLQTALARIVVDAGITSLAFSPDGTLLAGGRWDQTVWLWDPHTGKQLATFSGSSLSTLTAGRTDSIIDLAFSPDGTRLVAASLNSERHGYKQDQQFSLGTALVWDAKTGNRLITFRGPKETGWLQAAFAADGELIIATLNRSWLDDAYWVSFGPTVYLWDAKTGAERFALDHRQPVSYVVFSPKRTVLAVVTEYADLVFWDIDTGRHLATVVSLGNNYGAFSPDGSLFATPCGVWNVQTGENLAKQIADAICSHDICIRNMSFSPDGRLLAFLMLDGMVQLWGVR
jgi:WD40 repeat protein